MATLLSHFKPVPRPQGFPQKKGEASKQQTEEETTVPWVEKYRPRKVEEVAYQDEVVAVLKSCVEGADLPNLLFYGPPGTGKTSAAVALCRQLFKTPEVYRDRVLEMNASDERGIEIVRTRIKDFARISISNAKSKNAVVPLKVIILDEADAMTGSAQSALRRTIESETQTTRFFLICNYITRIIEPLTSRCAKFRFKSLSVEAQRERLTMISEKERVDIEPETVEMLVSACGGDLRKSITLLQSMSALGRQIGVEDVREMSGQVPDNEVELVIDSAQMLDPKMICSHARKITKKGYSINQMIHQLADAVLANGTLEPGHKAKLFEEIAAERRLTDGADEYLQMLNLMLAIQSCFVEADAQ